MILSFKKQFSEQILNGRKIHTIREDKPNRWKPGNKIHFATGVRTKKYNCFATNFCESVQTISIAYPVIGTESFTIPLILIDNKKLTISEIENLAFNDGFNSLKSFFEWFNKPFKGKIIHWTDYKY